MENPSLSLGTGCGTLYKIKLWMKIVAGNMHDIQTSMSRSECASLSAKCFLRRSPYTFSKEEILLNNEKESEDKKYRMYILMSLLSLIKTEQPFKGLCIER